MFHEKELILQIFKNNQFDIDKFLFCIFTNINSYVFVKHIKK